MKTEEENKIRNHIARLIKHELSFTNGWWIDEESYQRCCLKASGKIIKYL